MNSVPLLHFSGPAGKLTALEFEALPFQPARVFTISGVPGKSVRGSHAHKECEQLILCLSGRFVACAIGDGRTETLQIDSESGALHIPAMTWLTLYEFSADAVAIVLCSHPYDDGDYIRDFQDFVLQCRVLQS